MADEESGGETSIQIGVPPDLEPGVYANFLAVWHTGHEFTLDFGGTQPPVSEEGQTVVPVRVVARVRIPVSVIFDVIRALNENMTRYEDTYGDIKQLQPPDDEVGG